MAETKEQLKIKATLETSNLKNEARSAGNDVVNSLKSIERSANSAGQAFDSIGQSGSSALGQLTDAASTLNGQLSQVSNTVKGISIGKLTGQALKLANDLSDIGDEIAEKYDTKGSTQDKIRRIISTAGKGGLAGAGGGAMLGSIVPGAGTGIGAAIGFGVGAITGGVKEWLKIGNENDKETQAGRERARKARRENEALKASINENIADKARQKDLDALVKGGTAANLETLGGMKSDEEQKLDNLLKERENILKDVNLSNTEQLKALREIEPKIRKQDSIVSETNSAYEKLQREVDKHTKEEQQKQMKQAKAADTAAARAIQEDVKNREELLKPTEELAGRMAGMKLTDSLTSIGGGSGYGAQMQGITSVSGRMLSEVGRIKDVLQEQLNTAKQLLDKWTNSSAGEFVGAGGDI